MTSRKVVVMLRGSVMRQSRRFIISFGCHHPVTAFLMWWSFADELRIRSRVCCRVNVVAAAADVDLVHAWFQQRGLGCSWLLRKIAFRQTNTQHCVNVYRAVSRVPTLNILVLLLWGLVRYRSEMFVENYETIRCYACCWHANISCSRTFLIAQNEASLVKGM